METKKLYRSKTNKICCGIMGGIAEYFEFDPTILRLAWLFVVVFTGIIPGLLFYFLALLIVPKKID